MRGVQVRFDQYCCYVIEIHLCNINGRLVLPVAHSIIVGGLDDGDKVPRVTRGTETCGLR